MCVCVHICVYTSVYVHMCLCICVIVHVCMCMHVYAHVCAHVYAGDRELCVCAFPVSRGRTEHPQISLFGSDFPVGEGPDMVGWVDSVTGSLKGTSEAANL